MPTSAGSSQPIVAITGAHGALGQAIAAAFEANGAVVCRIDRSPATNGPGPGLAIGDVDLADAASTTKAFDAIGARFGRLDVLVNVAGGFEWEKLAGGSIETWDRLYAINVRTTVNASQAALPWLAKAGTDGRIVNIAAAASAHATAGMGAYSASKAGVVRLTEALADECKSTGPTVNAILPTIIDTARNRADMPDADFSRWVRPMEIAQVAIFLASPGASAVTGAAILVGARAT